MGSAQVLLASILTLVVVPNATATTSRNPGNPNFNKLLFYTCVSKQIGNQCDEGFTLDQAGIANAGVSNNLTTIAAGRAANISTLFAVHDTFFVNGHGLRPDWRQAWSALSTELEPLIKDRAVIGFFVGDELFPGKITLAEFKTALGALSEFKTKYPWLVIWENEGGTGWVDQFRDGGVPQELDLISMDDYYMGSSPQAEADGHRAFYVNSIYPLLHPHQKVLLVPGSFATHDPRAAGEAPKGYPHGNTTYCFRGTFAGCDEYMAEQARAFAVWATEDPRVAGIAAWHWDSRPIGVTTPYKEVGVIELPKTTMAWRQIGKIVRANGARYA